MISEVDNYWEDVKAYLTEIGVDINSDDFTWYADSCAVIARYTHHKLSGRDMMIAQDKLSDLLLPFYPKMLCFIPTEERIKAQIKEMDNIPELRNKGLTYDEKEALAFCVYYSRCVQVFDEETQKIVPTFSEFKSFDHIDSLYKNDYKVSHPEMF